jgi:hypothetical protein
MYHVKAIPEAPPGGLDLQIANEDEFSPDKLRSNIERLYVTVVVGLIGFGKHIARLRSWREPRRTAAFAAVYLTAWLLNLLVPTFLTFLLILIAVPRSRDLCFPPAPLALVSAKTGGITKPKAGVLGSHDSVTGAPEKYQGQAVEQEASNLVAGIATVAMSSAVGRHDQGDPEETAVDKAPDPTKIASVAADAKTSATSTGGIAEEHHDKTKQPMEEAIWAQMRPAMRVMGDIADAWERFANALSPVPPFSATKRYQLAAIVSPLLLLSLFVKNTHVVKGTTFLIGCVFFSDPLMQRGIALLNEKIPGWPKYLELRNSLLKGVPSNAQFTITLLRVGEANHAPIPPPPRGDAPPPDTPADLDKEALVASGLDASHSEIEDAITVSDPSSGSESQPSWPTQTKKKSAVGAKILSVFKHATAAGVETKLTADVVKAKIGSTAAKQKLGILPSKKALRKTDVEGPVEFKGRYQGRKGAIYVDSSVTPASGSRPASPCVYFTTHLDGNEAVESMPSGPSWAVSVQDIAEVQKVGGLGWKGRIVVGWATDRAVKDGIEITTKQGTAIRATALTERDALFNRLVSMGDQVWESW